LPKKLTEKSSTKFFSGLFLIAGIGILITMGISLGKESYRKKQIQKEIESLQSEIQATKQQNDDLSNLISYLSTSQYDEKEAREKLNLQKEDEKMIILQKTVEPQETAPTQSLNQSTNSVTYSNTPGWEKWLKYFFANKI
jgi:cell division protein FtsB